MGSELLRLHDAVVRRDGRAILDIDDFVIEEGEHVAVLGPNGSGKSTLIHLMTREVMPLWREEPPVLFRGDPRASIEEINRTIGVVSMSMAGRQRRSLTAFDVVLGGLFGTIGVPARFKVTDEHRKKAMAALEELGIADLAERPMHTFSTGQTRRVLVARALIDAPDVLVFDEPCVGLDPEAIWNLRQTFRALAKAGHTLVVVTHDVGDIIPEIERVVLLHDAHIVGDGPKKSVLTTENLRDLFGVPITLDEFDGHYSLH